MEMWHTLVLVVHVMLAIGLVIVILLQRSEGGALGIGSGPAGFMTARGAANALTRMTAILAGAFVVTSIGLAILAGLKKSGQTEVDQLLRQQTTQTAPATPGAPAPPGSTPTDAPAAPAPAAPSAPAAPAVPAAK
jgi:preprotein translocase subunit SecG